jgi:hypothetical protein
VGTSNAKTNAVGGFAAIILATAFSLAPARAQERCKVDEILPATNASYTEQHVMDVGDVPGHQIRIFELRRTFPDDKPNCEGLKRTQSVAHAATDRVDANGPLHGYAVISFDNGDKMFEEVSGIAQTVTNADGSKVGTYVGVNRITGGTGKYLSVRGLLRDTVNFDLAKNYNQSHTEGEYWFEK